MPVIKNEKIQSRLEKHEAICAERYKTIFSTLFELSSRIKRIETILMGQILALLLGVISLFFKG